MARTRSFAIHLRASSESENWRLGLVIPKRWEARAVARVAIKRAWREGFRCKRGTFERLGTRHDLVVRLCAKPPQGSLVQLKKWCRAERETLFAQVLHRLDNSKPALPCAPSSFS